eukprot:CAMPEP_0174303380 /NCGR_PEP_ID=MMETSP0809-20121228/60156_1 /TAXON_ID=73025 ORGANISM="Eutreptiella gymnastica-like, Strain CCMP1594" /NCGR_SAMPLE_ID=MMETSP0809 /ASSEMBLY_ACC=CAM_ASM_000658 /LENGTH=57 /DNA_ID=CAMNT_0015409399 /DNA_START=637 /DNA_END=810 /DNA_ORIENTATION=-
MSRGRPGVATALREECPPSHGRSWAVGDEAPVHVPRVPGAGRAVVHRPSEAKRDGRF